MVSTPVPQTETTSETTPAKPPPPLTLIHSISKGKSKPAQISLPGLEPPSPRPKPKRKRKRRKPPPKRPRMRKPPKAYPYKGAAVNPLIRAPDAPGDWVDDIECKRCGAYYDDFVPGIRWEDGRQIVRDFRCGDSRGPVLWAMRVMKLTRWYEHHQFCGLRGQWDLFQWKDGYYDRILDDLVPLLGFDPRDPDQF